MVNKWHGLYKVLDTFDESELRAIRRRCDWCDALPPDKAKTNFAKRIRNQARKSVEDDEESFNSIMNEIRDSIRRGPHAPHTRIRHILENTEIGGKVLPGETDVSMQMYGALRNEFGEQFNVYREHSIDGFSSEFDIYVENTQVNECYLIESKIGTNIDTKGTYGQVVKYNKIIDEHTDMKRMKTYLFAVKKDSNEMWSEACRNPDMGLKDSYTIPGNLREEVEQEPRTHVIKRIINEEMV